jgi:hypothetical protein
MQDGCDYKWLCVPSTCRVFLVTENKQCFCFENAEAFRGESYQEN